MSPTAVEQIVAMRAVPIMAVGCTDPAAARMATALAGMSCTELVFSARKVHIALVAVPGRGFSFSRSCMARNPSGVAALARPSMLAAMFMIIDPMAGCSAGTSGKMRVMTGRSNLARACISPDFSAKRITPSQSAMTPASGRASVITAVLQASNAAVVTSFICPVAPPSKTAPRTRASQM